MLFLGAFGGYWIAPDNTYLASQQIPELAQKPPFTTAFLAIPQKKSSSFLQVFWRGKPTSEIWVLKDDTPFFSLSSDTLLLHLKEGTVRKVARNQLEYEKPIVFTFYLGTDPLGRDILSRLIIGTRYSLGISFTAIIISIGLGISLGLVAGYFGGYYDKIISWGMNVFWALPSTLLAIGIAFAIGKGFFTLIIAISAVLWVDIARFVRLETMRIKENEFIKAAQTMGFSPFKIVFLHIFPNLLHSVLVVSFSTFTTALILEGSLSFLGLGVTPPAPSWGTLIFDGFYYIALSTGKWLLFAPALCLVITVLTLNYFASLWKKN